MTSNAPVVTLLVLTFPSCLSPTWPRSKISLGGKALSHDSVFVSDSSEANEALGASQDSIHGKVKSLQVGVMYLENITLMKAL